MYVENAHVKYSNSSDRMFVQSVSGSKASGFGHSLSERLPDTAIAHRKNVFLLRSARIAHIINNIMYNNSVHQLRGAIWLRHRQRSSIRK